MFAAQRGAAAVPRLGEQEAPAVGECRAERETCTVGLMRRTVLRSGLTTGFLSEAGAPNDGRSALHEQTLAARLVECVQQCLASAVDDVAVVTGVRRCGREARRDGMRPERLVVALRHAWYETVGGSWSRAEPDDRLLRLVDLALAAYFDDGGAEAN